MGFSESLWDFTEVAVVAAANVPAVDVLVEMCV